MSAVSAPPPEGDLATLLGIPPGGPPPTAPAARLTHLLRSGAYAEILTEPLAVLLLLAEDAASAGAAERARAHLAQQDAEKAAAAESILAVGAAALSLFAHANWTGAPVSGKLTSLALAEARDQDALGSLAVDGESAYALVEAPRLLCAARALLVDTLDDLEPLQSVAAPWWAARCAVLHQRCLESPSPSLDRLATRGLRRTLEALRAMGGSFFEVDDATASDEAAEETAAAAGGSAEPRPSLRGKAVMVLGLEGRPELNGQRGVVGVFDAAKGRYAVQFDAGGAPMLLKPDNLMTAGAAATAAKATSATSAVSAVSGASGASGGVADSGWPAEWPEAVGALWRDVRALAHLESAHNHMLHRRHDAAGNELCFAKAALGMQIELVGALGKRTKHQEHAMSLLVLVVQRVAKHMPSRGEADAAVEAEAAKAEAAAAGLPSCITEEDDQLLNEIALEGATDGKDIVGKGPTERVPLSALHTNRNVVQRRTRRQIVVRNVAVWQHGPQRGQGADGNWI